MRYTPCRVATQKVTVEKRMSVVMNVAMSAAFTLDVGSSSVYHTFSLNPSLAYSSGERSRFPPFLSYMFRRSNEPTFMERCFMLFWPMSLRLCSLLSEPACFLRSAAAFARSAFSAFFSFSWIKRFFTSSRVSNNLLYISKFTVMVSPSRTSSGSNPSKANDPPS